MLWSAVGVVLVALLAAVELGKVDIRLPFPPGVEYDYMAEPPTGSFPIKFNSSFVVDDTSLQQAQYILADRVTGVETVAVAPDGSLGIVDKFGRIYIAPPDGKGGYTVPEEPLAWSSPGATLGVKFDLAGSLYIANSPLGLLQLVNPGDAEQQKLVLASGRVSDESPLLPGYPVEFANSIDIAMDGTVYFSSSTDVLSYKTADGSWNVLDSVWVTLAKGAPAGMLLSLDPATGVTTALMDKLWFANGVAVSLDGSFVLVADSIQCRIHRYWLKGPKARTHEVFMDNLPGPPDGISKAEDGHSFWVTIYSPAPGLIKFANRRLVRLFFAWAPRIMRLFKLKLPKVGIVLRVDGEGNLLQTLGDPSGQVVWGVTSAVEAGGRLFMGSLHSKGIPVLDLRKVQEQ